MFSVSVVTAGCSLFTSLNGFSTGDGEGESKDGSTSPDGVGPNNDGASTDGGTNNPPDANAAFCTSRTSAAFCADFDSVKKFDENWSDQDIDPSSNLSIVDAKFASSPRSLRVAMPAKTQGTFYALIGKKLNTSTRRSLRLELDLFVTEPMWSGTGNVSFFSLGYYGPQLEVSQELFLNSDDTSALTTRVKREEPDSLEFTRNDVALPRDQWVHVKVETDFSTAGGFVRIWFNDQQVVNKVGTTYQSGAHDVAFLNIGFSRYNNGNTPAFEAFYDNVLLDFL